MRIILFLISLIISQLALARPEVLVLELAEVDENQIITLGEIAEFKNFTDQSAQDKIAEVEVLQNWQAGQSVKYENRELSNLIKIALDRAGYKDEMPSFNIPASVKIENSLSPINKRAVERKIVEYLKQSCSACQFKIEDTKVPKIKGIDVQTDWELDFNKMQNRGSFSLPLYVHQGDGDKPYWITGKIRVFRDVPVALRQINFNERLQENDFEIKLVEVTFAKDGVPSGQEVIGHSLQRAVNAGQAIYRSFLKREPALTRGQIARIVSHSGNIEVSGQAVAEESGFVGDVIKLKNIDTQKLISGQIVEKGMVRLQ